MPLDPPEYASRSMANIIRAIPVVSWRIVGIMDSDSWLNCCQGNALIERHWVRVPERFADNSDVATAMSRVWAMSFVTASFLPRNAPPRRAYERTAIRK